MRKKVISIVLAAAMPLSTIGGLNCFANGVNSEGRSVFARFANVDLSQKFNLDENVDRNLCGDIALTSSEQEEDNNQEIQSVENQENIDLIVEPEKSENTQKQSKVSRVCETLSNAKNSVVEKSKNAYKTISSNKLKTALCVGGIALAAGTAYGLFKMNGKLNELYGLAGKGECDANGLRAKLINTGSEIAAKAKSAKSAVIDAGSAATNKVINVGSTAVSKVKSVPGAISRGIVSYKNKALEKAERAELNKLYSKNEKLAESYGVSDKSVDYSKNVCNASGLKANLMNTGSKIAAKAKSTKSAVIDAGSAVVSKVKSMAGAASNSIASYKNKALEKAERKEKVKILKKIYRENNALDKSLGGYYGVSDKCVDYSKNEKLAESVDYSKNVCNASGLKAKLLNSGFIATNKAINVGSAAVSKVKSMAGAVSNRIASYKNKALEKAARKEKVKILKGIYRENNALDKSLGGYYGVSDQCHNYALDVCNASGLKAKLLNIKSNVSTKTMKFLKPIASVYLDLFDDILYN